MELDKLLKGNKNIYNLFHVRKHVTGLSIHSRKVVILLTMLTEYIFLFRSTQRLYTTNDISKAKEKPFLETL